jgi:hypothetical protein
VKLSLLYTNPSQKAIDNRDCYVESFRLEPELSVHIDNPLDEKPSRGVLYLSLYLCQIFVIYSIFLFFIDHRLIDFLSELSYALGVPHVELVTQRHRFLDLLFKIVKSLLASIFHYISSRECCCAFLVLTVNPFSGC